MELVPEAQAVEMTDTTPLTPKSFAIFDAKTGVVYRISSQASELFINLS